MGQHNALCQPRFAKLKHISNMLSTLLVIVRLLPKKQIYSRDDFIQFIDDNEEFVIAPWFE